MTPFLSVVMPTYNGEKFIASALGSIKQQYVDGLEVIVIDDGSSDRTPDIVREFAKMLPIQLMTPGRIRNWVATSNLGLREVAMAAVSTLVGTSYEVGIAAASIDRAVLLLYTVVSGLPGLYSLRRRGPFKASAAR